MTRHTYGGRHTERDKLQPLEKYLRAFTIALSKQSFELIYVDGFAGTGSREVLQSASPLFEGSDAEDSYISLPGSAQMALAIDPPLHRLLLIEQDSDRYATLERRLQGEWPTRDIRCVNGDANEIVTQFCETTNWRNTRAVMFLDPYGAQVRWETLEAIARTRAVDLWYFFPLMGLYRQAARDPKAIDASKRATLRRLLGTDDWEQAWYGARPASVQTSLFDAQSDDTHRHAGVDALERFVGDRLRSIFAGGVLEPRRVFNSRGNPLASLFFAVSNPRARGVASNIADQILRSGRASHTRSR